MPFRKQPRALIQTLSPESEPKLVIDGVHYALRNISEGGLGVWTPEPIPEMFKTGALLNGTLHIGRSEFPVMAEVRHIAPPRVVGLKLIAITRELAATLSALLEPAAFSAGLVVQGVPGEEDPRTGFPRIWFASARGAELVVWYNANQKMILALRVTWGDRSVFRHQFKGVETGELHDPMAAPTGGMILPEAFRIRHSPADASLVVNAAQFLVAAPLPIPGNVLWRFLESGEQVYLPDAFLTALKAA